MLSQYTIGQFALARLQFESVRNGPVMLTDNALDEMDAQAARDAIEMSKLPYDVICEQFVKLLKEMTDSKLPGMGRMWLVNKAFQEDPERFAAINAIMQHELQTAAG